MITYGLKTLMLLTMGLGRAWRTRRIGDDDMEPSLDAIQFTNKPVGVALEEPDLFADKPVGIAIEEVGGIEFEDAKGGE